MTSFIYSKNLVKKTGNIELVEVFPRETPMELRSREGHFITTNACVNKYIAGRTVAEYEEENSERKRECGKQSK